jgi:4,5-dihydroxyphthalate decarboxylase
MKKLSLTIAYDPFEFVRALQSGNVFAEGIDLLFQPAMSNPERHRAMVANLAFDVCELNIGSYLIAKDQNVPIVAIPVFLFRKFRHGNIFVRTDSGIREPVDLIGKRIGCPTLQPASNIWIHGILEQEHGLRHRSIHWVAERDEDLAFDAPSDLKVSRLRNGVAAIDLLLSGEIEAVTCPQTPAALIDGDQRIARLFPDYVARERDYYLRTGIFPIMHVTALPASLVKREPWIVSSLTKAFDLSKKVALHHFSDTRVATLAWFGSQWEEERRLLGADPWLNGLGVSNRKNIETVVRYAYEQGLIRRRMNVEKLFVC